MGEVLKFPPHTAQSYVSPYLLRPLRRVEEVEEARRRVDADDDVKRPDEKRPKVKQKDPVRAGD